MPIRKENLATIKANLLARRNFLINEIKRATSDTLNDEEVFFSDALDQASASLDKTLTVYIQNHERDSLDEIEKAIRRLDQGTFGDCVECEEPISIARMLANPSTTLCISCKAELESEQNRFFLRS